MTINLPKLPVISIAVAGLILGAVGQAEARRHADDNETPFAVADVYAELNNTDGDLGFHALIDGDAWKKLSIEDSRGRNMLRAHVTGRLRKQGLTEIFFESAEPNFEDLTPEEFFDRFPEGLYEIEGKTLDGKELESEDLFRHVMPAPMAASVNGSPMALQCDEDEAGYDITEVATLPVTLSWQPVTESHPTIGKPGEIEVAYYQVVAEVEVEANGEEFASVFSVILPSDVTEMTLPEEFIQQGENFKYEVLVKEATGGNQTAEESCFLLTN